MHMSVMMSLILIVECCMQVVVLAATNLPQVTSFAYTCLVHLHSQSCSLSIIVCVLLQAIDPALLRTGRFDRVVFVGPPEPEVSLSITFSINTQATCA